MSLWTFMLMNEDETVAVIRRELPRSSDAHGMACRLAECGNQFSRVEAFGPTGDVPFIVESADLLPPACSTLPHPMIEDIHLDELSRQ